jgi:hypothetical protein
MIMDEGVESLEERRRKSRAEREARERQVWHQVLHDNMELNKDYYAIKAFADAFVDILREVTRSQSNSSAAPAALKLARFFEMLERGASVTCGDLATAALERIQPHEEARYGTEETQRCENARLRVARAGLAYLIANAATDGAARGRLSQRERSLSNAIEELSQAQEALWRKGSANPPVDLD